MEQTAARAATRPLLLLVDDEADLRYVIRTNIEGLGCGLIEAADGESGWALASRYRPDVALIDMLLPKLDGLALCRLMEANPATASTRKILMSGVYTGARYRTETRQACQWVEFLAKPIDFAELRSVLARHLMLPEERRAHPRHAVAVRVRLERTETPERGPRVEECSTENLSRSGALVPVSTLPVAAGETLLFSMAGGRFRSRVAIRDIRIGADNVPRLHLWFLDQLIPDALMEEVLAGRI
jgi:CheY-like chemotaxis protein